MIDGLVMSRWIYVKCDVSKEIYLFILYFVWICLFVIGLLIIYYKYIVFFFVIDILWIVKKLRLILFFNLIVGVEWLGKNLVNFLIRFLNFMIEIDVLFVFCF